MGSVLCAAQGARRLADLLPQLLQVAGKGGFERIGEAAAAQPIRAALHARAEIVFVHAIEGAAQPVGSCGLRRRELARRAAHLLRKTPQVVGQLLAIGDHFVDFLRGGVCHLPAGRSRGILLRQQVAHVIRLLFLLGGQLIGRFSHGVQAAGGVLLLHAAEQIGGLAQAVGGAAGVGRTGILGDGAPHVVIGLAQAVERLLRRLLAAVGGLGLLSKLLRHLLLELLRLALQHFLLPFLLGGLGTIALLLGQILLAPGQFVELFQRVGDLLRFLFGGSRGGLAGLVLILLGVQFQIEEARQVARRTASAAPAAPAKRNLDLPEGRFGAQQKLQCLLLVGDGVGPLLL